MKKDEFLTMMTQDIATESGTNKKLYGAVLDVMKYVLDRAHGGIDIAPNKTVEGAYKAMETYARKNTVAGCCVITDEAPEIVAEYLGVKYSDGAVSDSVDLLDFI